jgi:hypothetical protein
VPRHERGALHPDRELVVQNPHDREAGRHQRRLGVLRQRSARPRAPRSSAGTGSARELDPPPARLHVRWRTNERSPPHADRLAPLPGKMKARLMQVPT